MLPATGGPHPVGCRDFAWHSGGAPFSGDNVRCPGTDGVGRAQAERHLSRQAVCRNTHKRCDSAADAPVRTQAHAHAPHVHTCNTQMQTYTSMHAASSCCGALMLHTHACTDDCTTSQPASQPASTPPATPTPGPTTHAQHVVGRLFYPARPDSKGGKSPVNWIKHVTYAKGAVCA